MPSVGLTETAGFLTVRRVFQFLQFSEGEGSIPSSQDSATETYPEPPDSSQKYQAHFPNVQLNIISHLLLIISNISPVLVNYNVYILVIHFMRTSRPAHA
jgi:hypothetical protein